MSEKINIIGDNHALMIEFLLLLIRSVKLQIRSSSEKDGMPLMSYKHFTRFIRHEYT